MVKNSLVGQRFGMLEVIEEESRSKSVYCLCKCDCGNTKWIRRDHLKKDIRSCGCQSTSNREKAKREDLTGQKFGRLTVVEKTDKKDYLGTAIYKCQCDCGNITEVNARALKFGNTRSCGCLRKEEIKKRSIGEKKKSEYKKENVEKNKRPRGENVAGQRFGHLTAIKPTDKRKRNYVVWECKCDCGNIIEVSLNNLKNVKCKHHCGCLDKKEIHNQTLLKSQARTGILQDLKTNKWITTIRKEGKSVLVGEFDSKDEALVALQEELKNAK